MGRVRGWVGADVSDNTWAGVVKVACVMTAIGIHVVEVALGTDVWVEELKVVKSL